MGVANIKLSSIYPDVSNNMRILVHKLNYKQLGKNIRLIKKEIPYIHSITLVYAPLIRTVNKSLFLGLKELRKPINEFLMHYQNKINISLSNIPYCVLDKEFWHMCSRGLFPEKQIEFSKECLKCKMYEECCGFYKPKFNKKLFEGIAPIKDLPEEVVIEVTSRCNLNCSFCFNKNSFARNRRKKIDLPEKKIKKIIDDAAKNSIEYIRFTGGEPLLRKDIFELLKYAKSKGFKEVRLNTNGTLVNSNNIKRLEKYVDNVLVPLNSYCAEEDAKCTGMKDVFKKRINALKLLKKSKISVVRSGAIALPTNINHLEEIFEIVKKLNLDSWEVYRPVPTPKNKYPMSKGDIKILVDKLLGFKERGLFVPIANALPFCSYDQEKISKVSLGAKYDDGHCRVVVDARGYAKPSYFIDVDVGDPTNIMKCWDNKFMRDLRSLKLTNEACKGCDYLNKCKGGSRFAANLINGSYNEIDPLSYEPFVSVVIPTYNRKNTLKLVLDSLFRQNYPKNKYEIVVVDDGSSDGTKETIDKLKKKAPVDLRYIKQERKGFRPGQAANLGAKNAKGKLLLFVWDDIVVIRDFIINHINAQKKADVVSGYRAGYKSDRLYKLEEIKKINSGKVPIIKEFRDDLFNDASLNCSLTNPKLWGVFVNGNFSIKEEIFKKNRFDESFVGYGEEDIEFAYRLYKQGYKIVLDKNCLGFHFHHEFGADGNYTKKKLNEELLNLHRFYKKHKNKEIARYISKKFKYLPFESLGVDRKDFENFVKSIRK